MSTMTQHDVESFEHPGDGLFADDAVKAAYHLALLEWPYSRHVAWQNHHGPDGEVDAAAAFYNLSRPTIVFLLGDAYGVGCCLESADLPEFAYLAFFPEHRPVLDRFYDLPGPVEMVRMLIHRRSLDLRTGRDRAGRRLAVELGHKELPALLDLYSLASDLRPDPYQFERGGYLGIFDSGTLVAAAGTHFVSENSSFAMIGNVFTHPDHRRRGLARDAVAALVRRLMQRVDRVCLNVRSDNTAAVKLYESLGFAAHCTYREGTSVLCPRLHGIAANAG